jgi:hypothetical protein
VGLAGVVEAGLDSDVEGDLAPHAPNPSYKSVTVAGPFGIIDRHEVDDLGDAVL